MNVGLRLFLGAWLVTLVAPSLAADWRLNGAASAVKFASVKNEAVGEVHYFTSIAGSVSGNWVEVRIQLASVETMIDIRNDRMREMLFEVAQFPEATIAADAGQLALDELTNGEIHALTVPLELSLHGRTQTLTASVRVTSLGDQVMVFNDAPLMVRAADFGLDGGVEALRRVAGLNAIDGVVPVTFTLVFEPSGSGVPQPPQL